MLNFATHFKSCSYDYQFLFFYNYLNSKCKQKNTQKTD